jgi:acyl-CoA thioester hydrolase
MRVVASEPRGTTWTQSWIVRWSECDPAGILYHPRVFDWFSEGRLGWLSRFGQDYYREWRSRGIELLVLECEARFRRPLRPGDAVDVTTAVGDATPTRLTFLYRVTRSGEVVAEGLTHHAFVSQGRPVNLSKRAPDLLDAFKLDQHPGPSPGKGVDDG